jgi:kynurenine formamidase
VTSSFEVIDLSAPLSPATIMWPGSQAISAEMVEEIERDGAYSRRVTVDEHSGTHFDAPSHFAAGGASVADVSAEQLVRPLRVIDIAENVGDKADTVLTAKDVLANEKALGFIEDGSAVFLRTGWERRLDDPLAYSGPAEGPRFPGFSVEAARLLVEERGVAGLGIDTLSIDVGHAKDFPVHSYVLGRGVWQVENLINLAKVPPVGTWAIIGVPRVADASGFPARVFALVPNP